MSAGLNRLVSLGHTKIGDEIGLEIPRRLLELLGNPQDKVPSIHVGGTNGKGSVCTTISAMLLSAGFEVGQFISPHLSDVCERFIINGKPIEKEELEQLVSEIFSVADTANLQPSYFEINTATAFLLFSRRALDWMVIEVGLGGRLDATNVIQKPQASVITGIDFDHMHFLGDSLAQIAREKAGIIKKGTPVFVGELAEDLRGVFAEVAAKLRTEIEFQGQDFTYRQGQLIYPSGEVAIDLARKALRGDHQNSNSILSARVGAFLQLEPRHIQDGLERVRWPGRLELITAENGSRFLLDAAHNPQGIEMLCAYLEQAFGGEFAGVKRLNLVFGAIESKDWKEMLRRLSKRIVQLSRSGGFEYRYVFTRADHPSSVSPIDMVNFVGSGIAEGSPEVAVGKLTNSAHPTEVTLITGSIYLLGRIRPLIHSDEFTTFCK